MKKTFKERFIVTILTLILTVSPLAANTSIALAEGEATSSAGSNSNQVNDPNNWYQQWLAKRAVMDAQLAAAANTSTGADSTNTATDTNNSSTNAALNNDGQIVNITDGTADTGSSDANRNTGDGSVTSGDASLVASVGSNANQVSIDNLIQPGVCSITTCAGVGDGSSTNSKTGAGSENDATVANNLDNNILINNDLDILNRANFKASSGYNDANRNTGDGSVATGDADLGFTAINVGNNVNVGAQVFNVMDDQTGDLVLNFDNIQTLQTAGAGLGSSNNQTGADSTNNATTTNGSNNTIVINNDGSLSNDYVLNAITGHNDANQNTGNGSVTTGDANVAVNVINFLNNTFLGGAGDLLLGIVNIFGNLNGNIVVNPPPGGSQTVLSPEALLAGNATTGSGSENNATSTNNNTLGIGVTNAADILNGITLNANTGSNDASKNTGSSSIQTGDINSQLKTTNIANTTSVGADGTLWLVLINNMGVWTGQIMGLDVNGVASPFFTFDIGPDGSLNAINDKTGADSTNNATTTNNSDTQIDVNNKGAVNNNIVINADTGHNSASKNTGDGSITTGNVNVAANVMNILNNTFIGGKLVVTIINVFGGFFGNVQTPGSAGVGSAVVPMVDNSAAGGSAGTAGGPSNNSSHTASHGSTSTNSNTGEGSSNTSQVSGNKNQSLVLAANDFGTPKITKVVNQAEGGLPLRNIIFFLIITAASAQVLLKLSRRGWLTRKA